ncbi:hypothetical protein ACFSHP_11185 [Novosphingobium panipatense]
MAHAFIVINDVNDGITGHRKDLLFHARQREAEQRTAPFRRLGPDAAAVGFDNGARN